MSRNVVRICLLFVVIVVLSAAASQLLAGKPGPSPCPQPKPGCICITLYDPVVCDGGCTYSNSCFARCAGARGCVPAGPGPVEL